MYLIEELQRWLREQGDLDGVALLPTLRREADLGYDVGIRRKWSVLYLQFKIPQYLSRKNSAEYPFFEAPYFRFKVKSNATRNGNVQHNILCDLEAAGEAVFYASPCFLSEAALNEYALSDGMYANSVFPRPMALGFVREGSSHVFAYVDSRNVRTFSEPGPRFSASNDDLQLFLRSSVQRAEPTLLKDFLSGSLRVVHSLSRRNRGLSELEHYHEIERELDRRSARGLERDSDKESKSSTELERMWENERERALEREFSHAEVRSQRFEFEAENAEETGVESVPGFDGEMTEEVQVLRLARDLGVAGAGIGLHVFLLAGAPERDES